MRDYILLDLAKINLFSLQLIASEYFITATETPLNVLEPRLGTSQLIL